MLLKIKDLSIKLVGEKKNSFIVEGINVDIEPQKIVALVGGSGSGKTTIGLSIIQLLSSALEITQGEIIFEDKNILNFSSKDLCGLRGKEIAVVFQEPLQAFNPIYRIGYQIEEVLRSHTSLARKERRQRILDFLTMVGFPEPKAFIDYYPHQLSGGMRQRAMIAQAIAASPKLIIADEPTSSLDVTLQARVMELFCQLRNQLKLSMLLITHDLGMVSHLADYVYVISQGKIVETGPTQDIIKNPQHSYTKQLMEASQI